MAAWMDWYHVSGSTYGTWVRGDPRGWRARQHREHVEGDYRNPPPEGKYDGLFLYSHHLMKSDPVFLTREQCGLAGRAMVDALRGMGIQLLVLSLDRVHYHLLAKFPGHDVKAKVGRAKKKASDELSKHGLLGRVWAKGCHVEPAQDRTHQVNAYEYVKDHELEGAWVWTYRDGP